MIRYVLFIINLCDIVMFSLWRFIFAGLRDNITALQDKADLEFRSTGRADFERAIEQTGRQKQMYVSVYTGCN